MAATSAGAGGMVMGEVSTARCPGCGAPLAVPVGAARATCGYCGTEARVEVGGGEVALVALDRLAATVRDEQAATRAQVARLELREQRAALVARADALAATLARATDARTQTTVYPELQRVRARIADLDRQLDPEGFAADQRRARAAHDRQQRVYAVIAALLVVALVAGAALASGRAAGTIVALGLVGVALAVAVWLVSRARRRR